MQGSPLPSLSPSFNSYSNTKLTAIAARVVEEFNSNESIDENFSTIDEKFNSIESIDDEFCFRTDENSHTNRIQQSDDEDADLEFAFVNQGSELPSPISPDEIFQNGRIRPVYPVFNRDLLRKHVNVHHKDDDEATPRIRLPLRRLFIEERESAITTSSSSSSEADELDGVPAEMYCVWRPKEEEEVKSSSSNSKRWKLKDLLLPRSHSDGSKDSFVFLNLRKNEKEEKVKDKLMSSGNKKSPPVNRSGGEKRRTYLPYRQDLLGLFGNVNGLSKNL